MDWQEFENYLTNREIVNHTELGKQYGKCIKNIKMRLFRLLEFNIVNWISDSKFNTGFVFNGEDCVVTKMLFFRLNILQ